MQKHKPERGWADDKRGVVFRCQLISTTCDELVTLDYPSTPAEETDSVGARASIDSARSRERTARSKVQFLLPVDAQCVIRSVFRLSAGRKAGPKATCASHRSSNLGRRRTLLSLLIKGSNGLYFLRVFLIVFLTYHSI